MKVVVFLGPSLPLAEARAVLPDAVFLPPARQSDLLSALGIHKPDVVGLVDGEFGQSLSVWHKEILYALERGVAVYGSSSMGALRAAETAAFGTRGVGRIFEMYASGELNDDDEVALSHGLGDAGYRNFSEPMVNLRATFHAAAEHGLIDAATRDTLVEIAKQLFFPERVFARIFEEARARGLAPATIEALRAFVRDHYVDLKRQDALLLLQTLRDLTPEAARFEPNFKLTRSHLFETLYHRDRRVLHDDFEVPLAVIANYAALHLAEFNELNAAALNRSLVQVLADVFEVTASEQDIDDEARRFRLTRRLMKDEDLAAWCARNDLLPEEFRTLMGELAVCRQMQRWLINSRFGERTTRIVLDELRLTGHYEQVAREAAAQERIIEEHHQDFKETSFAGLDTNQLVIDHLRATDCKMPVHARLWSDEAGFHTPTDLRVELLRARLVRELRARMARSLAEGLADSPAGTSVETRS
jgi:hypothetical protein